MDKTTINELNAFLKGEYMAIDSYEKYIKDIEDMNVKGALQDIQKDHKNHAIMISGRIHELNGSPVTGVGITGKMAEAMANIKDIGRTGVISILKDAYNGEDNGIKMAQEVVKGDLDNQSMQMINDIVDVDKSHLNKLNGLIKTQEGIH